MSKLPKRLIAIVGILFCALSLCVLFAGGKLFGMFVQNGIGPRPSGYETPWYSITKPAPTESFEEGYLPRPIDGKFIDEPYEYAKEFECAPMGGFHTIDVVTDNWRYILEPAEDGGVNLTKFKKTVNGVTTDWEYVDDGMSFEKAVTVPYERKNGNPGFFHAGNCNGALIILK